MSQKLSGKSLHLPDAASYLAMSRAELFTRFVLPHLLLNVELSMEVPTAVDADQTHLPGGMRHLRSLSQQICHGRSEKPPKAKKLRGGRLK